MVSRQHEFFGDRSGDRSALLTGPGNWMPQVAFAFLIAGLSFRIAAVPFHFYAPDVFQGTTASNAALLSFVPKVVGFVALLRLLPLTSERKPRPAGCRRIRCNCCWPRWPCSRCSSAISWRGGSRTCID